jgi:hypothetical protein
MVCQAPIDEALAALRQKHKNKCTRQCTVALQLFLFVFTREWDTSACYQPVLVAYSPDKLRISF